MDFFGFGAPAELSTPVGIIVKAATNSMLIGPDWTKNLEVCDRVNNFNEGADAVKAITRQIHDNDAHVVYLSLILMESCMKNCQSFPRVVNRVLMDEVVAVARGKKGGRLQDDALRLIQSWGKQFERQRGEIPLFYDAYISLVNSGLKFPKEEVPVPNPEGSASKSKSTHNASNSNQSQTEHYKQKLQEDLNVVLEKVKLCREMLPQSPGIQSDEALAEVVGFLEACRDRMIDLIEAGTQGLLDEDLFASCLRVNDALLRTLDAEKNGTPIAVDDDDLKVKSASENASNTKQSANSESMKPSLIDDDDFSNLTLKPTTKKVAPIIKPPPDQHKQATKLQVPPPIPPPNQQDLLDFGTTPSPAVNIPPPTPNQPAAVPPSNTTKTSLDDELAALFMNSGNADVATAPNINSSTMSDKEFESFLSGVSK